MYLRNGRSQGLFRRLRDLIVDCPFKPVDAFGIQKAITQEAHLKFGQRIAQSIDLALFLGAVGSLIVRKRMRVETDYMPMNKGRTVAGTAVLDGAPQGVIALDRIG